MRYRIERRQGVTELPAWWNVGGTAFHEAVREWETSAAGDVVPSADDAAARFTHHLAEQIAETVLRTGKGPHEWRTGGRASKAYPDKEDRAWWLDNGPEMVAKYVVAQEGRGSEVLRLQDGSTLALELGFTWQPPDGRPPVKGFIDQVLYFPAADTVLMRDLKSGSNMPIDRLQLGLYRLALEDVFGITARKWWGDYWNARKGVETRGHDLTDRARVEAEVFHRLDVMDRAEREGLYTPNPGNNCSACGVRTYCPAVSDAPFALWAPALDAPSVSE